MPVEASNPKERPSFQFEVDDFVPLLLKADTNPIGANFYRIGDFKTTLVEIYVHPDSLEFRGLKIVLVNSIVANLPQMNVDEVPGIPVFVDIFGNERIVDNPQSLNFFIKDGRIGFVPSETSAGLKVSYYEGHRFFYREDELVGYLSPKLDDAILENFKLNV